MRRVYVAGPYRGKNVTEVLCNIGRGEKMCSELFATGAFAVFCPWHDKTYLMDNYKCPPSIALFQKHSMMWLEVSDAVLVLPGWERSEGTRKEIKRAEELNIPVFYNVDDLMEWYSEIIQYGKYMALHRGEE